MVAFDFDQCGNNKTVALDRRGHAVLKTYGFMKDAIAAESVCETHLLNKS